MLLMRYIYFIFLVIFLSINTLPFLKLTECFIPLKPKKWCFFIALFLLACVNNVVIFNQDITNITWAFIGYLLILWLIFDGHLIQRISTAFILYPFIVCFNYLLDSFRVIEAFLSPDHSDMLYSFIHFLLIGLFWSMMYMLFAKRVRKARHYLVHKTWILLAIISIFPLACIGYIIITTPNAQLLFTLPIVIFSLLENIVILYLISFMAEHAQTELANESLLKERAYYQEVERNQLEIRKLRHDMNNHLSIIKHLLDNDELQEAKSYFNELSAASSSINRVFCQNTLINALLCTKYNLAEANHIDTFFHIDINSAHTFSDLDLCSLLSNSLDNAIEACLNLPIERRSLSLKIRLEKGFLFLQLTNSTAALITPVAGKYLSTKKEPHHGLGLTKITDIVKKYNGTLSISPKADCFVLTIALPL